MEKVGEKVIENDEKEQNKSNKEQHPSSPQIPLKVASPKSKKSSSSPVITPRKDIISCSKKDVLSTKEKNFPEQKSESSTCSAVFETNKSADDEQPKSSQSTVQDKGLSPKQSTQPNKIKMICDTSSLDEKTIRELAEKRIIMKRRIQEDNKHKQATSDDGAVLSKTADENVEPEKPTKKVVVTEQQTRVVRKTFKKIDKPIIESSEDDDTDRMVGKKRKKRAEDSNTDDDQSEDEKLSHSKSKKGTSKPEKKKRAIKSRRPPGSGPIIQEYKRLLRSLIAMKAKLDKSQKKSPGTVCTKVFERLDKYYYYSLEKYRHYFSKCMPELAKDLSYHLPNNIEKYLQELAVESDMLSKKRANMLAKKKKAKSSSEDVAAVDMDTNDEQKSKDSSDKEDIDLDAAAEVELRSEDSDNSGKEDDEI